MFTITGIYPPATFISPTTGIRYAVSGSSWVEIPMDMTYHEILAGWIDNNKVPAQKQPDRTKIRAWDVPSSKPDHPPYEVRLIRGIFECHCKGYQFFGWCHHITDVQNKLLIEEGHMYGKDLLQQVPTVHRA